MNRIPDAAADSSAKSTGRLQRLVDRLYPHETLAAACLDLGPEQHCLVGVSRGDRHFIVRFRVERTATRRELAARCRAAVDHLLDRRDSFPPTPPGPS